MRHQTAKRLADIESQTMPPDRCETCRHWAPAGVQMVDDQNGELWPNRCPDCGNTISTRVTVDYGDLDLSRI